MSKILQTLNSNIEILDGIGPYGKKLLKDTCNGDRLIDLLLYLPKSYNQRKFITNFYNIENNDVVIFEGEILKVEFKTISKIIVESNRQIIEIVYFRNMKSYLEKIYRVGETKVFSGKITRNGYSGNFQMSHPDYVLDKSKLNSIPKIETNYTLPKGLNNKMISGYINQIFDKINSHKNEIEEWIDEEILQKYNWKSFFESLKVLHLPNENTEKNEIIKAKNRIIFDEFFASQLVLKKLKLSFKSLESRSISGDGRYRNKILENLGFDLTNDQKTALHDIYEDQKSSTKMIRMVQGDVGSGKTIVALMAMMNSVECGFQAALMVPTEILAQQHFESISNLLKKSDINLEILLLTSTSKKKKQLLEKISSGEAQIIIGTHALFQNTVQFHQLGLVVIDEQHRFGVGHRQMLSDKDSKADLLFMSATPIPRSLSLVNYGYMDHSLIIEKPSNRLPVITSVVPSTQLDEIIDKIDNFLSRDERVYWICPLIEESLKLDYIAIEKREKILSEKFGDQLASIHGRMKDSEIDKIMKNFADETDEIDGILCKKKILLATTLIEVGVNVPKATLIVIEDAQKFGLSQLHQLRGRVGRSNLQSFCILIYNVKGLTISGKARLNALKKSTDGFFIAEQDLKIRGSGEFAGHKQSGYDNYRTANINEDGALLREASQEAGKIFTASNDLPEKFQTLIKIFNIDDIDSGGF